MAYWPLMIWHSNFHTWLYWENPFTTSLSERWESFPTLIATARGVRWSWFVMFLKQSFGSRSTSHWRHWRFPALAAICNAVLALESVILITISLVPPSLLYASCYQISKIENGIIKKIFPKYLIGVCVKFFRPEEVLKHVNNQSINQSVNQLIARLIK